MEEWNIDLTPYFASPPSFLMHFFRFDRSRRLSNGSPFIVISFNSRPNRVHRLVKPGRPSKGAPLPSHYPPW